MANFECAIALSEDGDEVISALFSFQTYLAFHNIWNDQEIPGTFP